MKSIKVINSGRNILVEYCENLSINSFVSNVRDSVRNELLIKGADINGNKIELLKSDIGVNGYRYWFKCPICTKRIGKVYLHPINKLIGCRICLNLEYRSRRYKGMIESQIES